MQYRYGAGGDGSFLAAFAAWLFLAFGGPTSANACVSSSSCFGGSGGDSTARNFLNEYK